VKLDACAGPATRTAVSVGLSTSPSLPRTPGAPTPTFQSSFMLYVLFAATGGSLIAVIVIETVATFESAVPSFALYEKLSVPLKLEAGV
jgi:hypothetical protein